MKVIKQTFKEVIEINPMNQILFKKLAEELTSMLILVPLFHNPAKYFAV